MNTLSFTQSEHTRKELLHFIQNSLSPELWRNNACAIGELKQRTASHDLFRHPMLERLKACQLSLEQLKSIHVNYFTAIVKIFTDAQSMLIYQAAALENNANIHKESRISAKVYARYLLSLNLMDELGFNTHNLAQSSPAKSHLIYFLDLMRQLELDASQQHKAEAEAHALQEFIQQHMHSYADLLLLLACTELQVIKFSEALRINMQAYDPAFALGYYACHGIADNSSQHLANDDKHEDDIWALLTQCFASEHSQHYKKTQSQYLELWNNFWSRMHQMAA